MLAEASRHCQSILEKSQTMAHRVVRITWHCFGLAKAVLNRGVSTPDNLTSPFTKRLEPRHDIAVLQERRLRLLLSLLFLKSLPLDLEVLTDLFPATVGDGSLTAGLIVVPNHVGRDLQALDAFRSNLLSVGTTGRTANVLDDFIDEFVVEFSQVVRVGDAFGVESGDSGRWNGHLIRLREEIERLLVGPNHLFVVVLLVACVESNGT